MKYSWLKWLALTSLMGGITSGKKDKTNEAADDYWNNERIVATKRSTTSERYTTFASGTVFRSMTLPGADPVYPIYEDTPNRSYHFKPL